MADISVSMVGTVAKVPQLRTVFEGVAVCNFRVACTPRRLDRTRGEWVDEETLFFGVACWRRLAEHVHASLQLGDSVLIRGRLVKRSYITQQGEAREALDIEATHVGVDLVRGTARQQRPTRAAVDAPADPAESDEGADESGPFDAGDDGTQRGAA